MKIFKLRITVEDLKGAFSSNCDCPIARALSRYTEKSMCVGGLEAGFESKRDGEEFNVFTFNTIDSNRVAKNAYGKGKRAIIINIEDHR